MTIVVHTTEDTDLTQQLRYFDTSDDPVSHVTKHHVTIRHVTSPHLVYISQVTWSISRRPSLGRATITSTWELYYQPLRDVFGEDTLEVAMQEYGLEEVVPVKTGEKI